MKINSKKQRILRHVRENIVAYLILAIFTVIFAYPILWSVISSFKTSAEIRQSPFALPAVPQFVNYANAWNAAHMGDYFLNSVFVTALSMALLIVLVIPCSYVLTRFNFRFRNFLRLLMMAGLFINVNYIVYPIYLMINGVSKTLFGNGLLLTDNLVTVAV
ncbi:MAG: carbohydrate ABC transporter permease, partial [Spirochaetaceae bacterium]|nr:carbohydrate ABC transporter permease [Spirochaetaceae bacterium]